MNIELLLQRLTDLAASRGESLNTVFLNSGVGKNFKSNLKNANPSLGKLTMLANYFGVSVDYLLGKTDEAAPAGEKKTAPALPLTDAEKQIFISYRSNQAFREAVDNILRLMPKEDPKAVLGAGRIFRAARSSDDHDAELLPADAALLDKLDKLPDTDEL